LGAVKPEMELDKNFKVKAELNTNHLGKIQVIASDLIEGSKFDVTFTQKHDPTKDLATNEIEGKAIYSSDYNVTASVGASTVINDKKSPIYKGQIAVNYPENIYWYIGGEYTTYTEGEKSYYDLSNDAKVSYIQPTYEALGNVLYKRKDAKLTYTASWFQAISNVNYGVVFSSTLATGTWNNIQTSFDVAGENKTNSGAILKGRVTTTVKSKSPPAVRGAFSLAQKISPGFTFTVGVDLNARQLFNIATETDQPHSFGFEVKLND